MYRVSSSYKRFFSYLVRFISQSRVKIGKAVYKVYFSKVTENKLDEVHNNYPPNVSGTPTLGLYQPRALCAVASHLLPGLRCEEDFCRGFRLPHGPVYPLHTRCQCVWPSPVACVAARFQHHLCVHPRPRAYAHYTPSQGSANRSASEGVLGAMARPAPVSPLFITVLPPLNSPSHPYSPQHMENHGNSAKFKKKRRGRPYML